MTTAVFEVGEKYVLVLNNRPDPINVTFLGWLEQDAEFQNIDTEVIFFVNILEIESFKKF